MDGKLNALLSGLLLGMYGNMQDAVRKCHITTGLDRGLLYEAAPQGCSPSFGALPAFVLLLLYMERAALNSVSLSFFSVVFTA